MEAMASNVSNSTTNGSLSNGTDALIPPQELTTEDLVTVIIWGLICIVGLVGNGLVIFVITRYTKMKTVTNLYILNLSIADLLFLIGMPMIITTTVLKGWVFGYTCCKLYFMTTCINSFTGSFTLTVMSGDRFLAVCYPINSMRYRTRKYALIVIGITWAVSFVVMLPIILYAQTTKSARSYGGYTCIINWPIAKIQGSTVFTLYNLLLGFVLPVLIISILYTLLIIRLRTTSSALKRDKRRPHRKVTRLVSLIIGVYIICWLPYWVFQVHLISGSISLAKWKIDLYKVFTLLSYANSMINPVLYAFTNDNFRESFISAFKCARDPILGGSHRNNSEYVPANNHCNDLNGKRSRQSVQQESQTQYEFMVLNGESDKVTSVEPVAEEDDGPEIQTKEDGEK